MILPDANLLLYAYNESAAEHEPARAWWERALSGDESIGLCWQTLTAFLRIGTNPRAFPKPLSAEDAISIAG
ncbi:MAG: type II toxin-antitoxin system VapC family toxin, partial [Thermoflexales bacterium]